MKHEIGGAAHVTHEPSHRLLIFGEQFVQIAGGFELPPPVGEGDVVVGVLFSFDGAAEVTTSPRWGPKHPFVPTSWAIRSASVGTSDMD